MPDIHLLNPMENAFGGSEQRTLALSGLLEGQADVFVWALDPPDPRLTEDFVLNEVDLASRRFPRSGTFVFVGCYFDVPGWLSVARPNRVIVIYNIPFVNQLAETLYVAGAYGHRCEIVTANQKLEEDLAVLDADAAGTEPSWIDLDRFAPSKPPKGRPFTIGRLSRDVPEKFHAEDARLFWKLGEQGIHVRLMGAKCLAARLYGAKNVEILPAGAMTPEEFLSGIDVLVYRTSEHWTEAWGRVVSEAMASGLPVVVERRVGIAAELAHEKDALIFDSTDEACDLVLRLRDDAALRRRLGVGARKSIERILGPEVRQKWIEFYTRA